MPAIVGDHSQLPMTLAMRDGVIRGLFVMGQNPVVGGTTRSMVQRGLAKLDWMVVRDIAETETASFWYDGQMVRDGEMRPEDIEHRGLPDAGRACRARRTAPSPTPTG